MLVLFTDEKEIDSKHRGSVTSSTTSSSPTDVDSHSNDDEDINLQPTDLLDEIMQASEETQEQSAKQKDDGQICEENAQTLLKDKNNEQADDETEDMDTEENEEAASIETSVCSKEESSSKESSVTEIEKDIPKAQSVSDKSKPNKNTPKPDSKILSRAQKRGKSKESRKAIMSSLSSLQEHLSSDGGVAALAEMPSHQLVQLHSQLNTMMTQVVIALKEKCPMSPTSSQDSQCSQE